LGNLNIEVYCHLDNSILDFMDPLGYAYTTIVTYTISLSWKKSHLTDVKVNYNTYITRPMHQRKNKRDENVQ